MSPRELQTAQAEAVEQEISDMAERLKHSALATNKSLTDHSKDVRTSQDRATENIDKVTHVTSNGKDHANADGGKWAGILSNLLLTFSFLVFVLVVVRAPKRHNSCLLFGCGGDNSGFWGIGEGGSRWTQWWRSGGDEQRRWHEQQPRKKRPKQVSIPPYAFRRNETDESEGWLKASALISQRRKERITSRQEKALKDDEARQKEQEQE